MAWLGGLALAGLAACALWALWDHVRTRIIRAHSRDPSLRTPRRGIVLGRLLLGGIVVATALVVGITVLFVFIELRG